MSRRRTLVEDITTIWHWTSIDIEKPRYTVPTMKKDIHPESRMVVFEDASANYRFLTRTTMNPDPSKNTVWEDGNTYPIVQLDISNASHPFFTGQMKIIDSAGRVERFNKRYGSRKKAVVKKAPVAKK